MRQPTQSEWSTISTLFDTLHDLPADTQEQRIAASDLDPFVTRQLRSLLAAARGEGVLDGSVSGGGQVEDGGYASLAAGAVVGAFRIERLIGRGGMGEVYLAERVEGGFAQRVALKMLRPEAAGRTQLFDAERALLATLEHPGIARLIDGGIAPDGRPYMALEYVEGQEIVAWCSGRNAGLAERLRLFLEVCDAVAYAHARLIVHRDIKPSNILIDDDGRARLLDFGVAKIVDDATADATMTQAMLTPDYAAPEQLENSPATVSTDVYALGAVLFELLTGRGPWRFDGAQLPSVIRRLLHEDPPVPSRFAAEQQHAPVAPQRIAGDLDAIILKAMRRSPADRYQGVAALAEDVRRHLDLKPVRARAGSTGYYAGRFVRRHRWAVAASAAGLLAILIGAGGIAWQARQTAVERDIARGEARRAEAVNTALTLMFRDAQESGTIGTATVRDLLRNSTEKLIASFGPGSADTPAVVLALADIYSYVHDPAGTEVMLDAALAKNVAGNDGTARARMQLLLAQAKAVNGKYDEAERLLAASDRYWALDPQRFPKQRQESISAHAMILRHRGQRDAAIALLTQALPDAEAIFADEPRELMTRYANLAVHLVESNRVDELGALLDRAEAAAKRLDVERSPEALALIQMRGGWHSRRGEHEAALAVFERATALQREIYGASALLSVSLLQVGRTQTILARFDDAVKTLDEAYRLAVKYQGAESQVALTAGASLGEAAANAGQLDLSRRMFAAVEPATAKLGPDSLVYGSFLRGRSRLHIAARQVAAATSDLDRAEQIFRRAGPAGAAFTKDMPILRKQVAALGRS